MEGGCAVVKLNATCGSVTCSWRDWRKLLKAYGVVIWNFDLLGIKQESPAFTRGVKWCESWDRRFLQQQTDWLLGIHVFWVMVLCFWVGGCWCSQGMWYLHRWGSRGPRKIESSLTAWSFQMWAQYLCKMLAAARLITQCLIPKRPESSEGTHV